MKSEIRKTAAGTEYWDNEEKRVLFVPTGSEPNFEVTKNPKSLVTGVDLARGKDKTLVNGKPIATDIVIIDEVPDADIELDNMDADQLRDFAKQNNIDLPFNVKKEETIRKNIVEALATANDSE